MQRDALERLSKAELIELVLRLQRPEKTSRTSSKPPSTDRKERREHAKPGGAKPGHAGHSRPLSDDVSERLAHRPEVCPCCRMVLAPDLPAEAAGVWECIELPAVRPQVVHRDRRTSGGRNILGRGSFGPENYLVGHPLVFCNRALNRTEAELLVAGV